MHGPCEKHTVAHSSTAVHIDHRALDYDASHGRNVSNIRPFERPSLNILNYDIPSMSGNMRLFTSRTRSNHRANRSKNWDLMAISFRRERENLTESSNRRRSPPYCVALLLRDRLPLCTIHTTHTRPRNASADHNINVVIMLKLY